MDTVEFLLGSLAALVVGVLIILCIDIGTASDEPVAAVVVHAPQYQPSYSTYTGKVRIHHPSYWFVLVRAQGEEFEAECSGASKLAVGDSVTVLRSVGMFGWSYGATIGDKSEVR